MPSNRTAVRRDRGASDDAEGASNDAPEEGTPEDGGPDTCIPRFVSSPEFSEFAPLASGDSHAKRGRSHGLSTVGRRRCQRRGFAGGCCGACGVGACGVPRGLVVATVTGGFAGGCCGGDCWLWSFGAVLGRPDTTT